MVEWTTEQVHSFAADSGTAARAAALAKINAWSNLSVHIEATIFAICKAGSKPYQVAVDVLRPAFQCNCPSRKRPCKHAVGLFQLYTEQHNSFEKSAQFPKWITVSRKPDVGNRAEEKANKETYLENALSNTERLKRMAAGLEEMKLWIQDSLRLGIVQLSQQPEPYWQDLRERMVDAQLPGLQRYISSTALHSAASGDWVSEMLAGFGEIHLLAKGFENLRTLPSPTQETILQHLGVNVRSTHLNTENHISDTWIYLGFCQGVDNNLQFRRSWYFGIESAAYFKEVQYLFGSNEFPDAPQIGTHMRGTAIVYPGAGIRRISIKEHEHLNVSSLPKELSAASLWSELQKRLINDVVEDPWYYVMPIGLNDICVGLQDDEIYIYDTEKNAVQISKDDTGWKLLALSAGNPIYVFGEYGAGKFRPISAHSRGRWVKL